MYELEAELNGLTQGNLSVNSYYIKLQSLWKELDTKMGTCTCKVAKGTAQECESRCIYKFLMGLNPEFSTARSNLLNIEEIPNLNWVLAHVVREERQITLNRSHEVQPEAAAFIAKGKMIGGKSSQMYQHFKKSGHKIDDCYQLHGYPGGWEQRRNAKSPKSGKG